MVMSTSQAGIDLIKDYETLQLRAHIVEAGGIYTIGYGHRSVSVTEGMVITQEEAEAFLREDLKTFEDIVNRNAEVPLTQNQFDALVSLTFNAGLAQRPSDSVWTEINSGDFGQAMIEFASHRRANLDGSGSKIIPGLVARRNDEIELFMGGDATRNYNYTDHYSNQDLAPDFIGAAVLSGLVNGTVTVDEVFLLLNSVGPDFKPALSNALVEYSERTSSGDVRISRKSLSAYEYIDDQRYFDPTPDGDLSDAVWLDANGFPLSGAVNYRGRTVAQEQRAQENLDNLKELLGIGESGGGKMPLPTQTNSGGTGNGGSRKDKKSGGATDAFEKSKLKASEKTGTKDTKKPIILDLAGDGIDVTELSQSQTFVDANNDGLQNKIAWAGVMNGVLFYDPDDTGEITETRQFIFTEWDPTAGSDLEALKSVFDTNNDGALSGAELADFKLIERSQPEPLSGPGSGS